jgi:hypothetical protein
LRVLTGAYLRGNQLTKKSILGPISGQILFQRFQIGLPLDRLFGRLDLVNGDLFQFSGKLDVEVVLFFGNRWQIRRLNLARRCLPSINGGSDHQYDNSTVHDTIFFRLPVMMQSAIHEQSGQMKLSR